MYIKDIKKDWGARFRTAMKRVKKKEIKDEDVVHLTDSGEVSLSPMLQQTIVEKEDVQVPKLELIQTKKILKQPTNFGIMPSETARKEKVKF